MIFIVFDLKKTQWLILSANGLMTETYKSKEKQHKSINVLADIVSKYIELVFPV